MAKHQPLLCFTLIFYLRRMAKYQPLLCSALIFISSPNGEMTTAALFCLNLYFFAEWRNNYRFSVLPESLTLRRTGEIFFLFQAAQPSV
jgi:hypothetical protein